MGSAQYSRRSALRHIGLLMASVAGREFLATWLRSANVLAMDSPAMGSMHSPADAAPSAAYVPQFFAPQEFRTVEELTEMILPRDDKPGAKDARVADYIDFVVFSAAEFEPGMQKDWADGLALLERYSHEEFGHRFMEISGEQRHSLLTGMSLPETDPSAHHEGYAFYRIVKETTVEGFYTSRIGLMNALEYKGLSFLISFPGCTHPEHQN
jgi:gluconate 2-dehydrogenase gamma chain